MVESFGLLFEPLADLLGSLRCVVAGGSMVHAYMGGLPGNYSGDLDIFCKPVDDYQHPETQRLVQMIQCEDPQHDVPGCARQLDLSAAATFSFFDGASLSTLYPDTTDRWETFWLWGSDHLPARLAKYQDKVFKLVAEGVPCPAGPPTPAVWPVPRRSARLLMTEGISGGKGQCPEPGEGTAAC
ncbi:N-acetyl-gamma-glutamyl-phosphate reductase [Micractinium conductrix]|uniref:N-acetyl-gamma-glutamyl-phosphate reductase n=1 Tax=Micractinium conductrix TaxID=554055 RepID=A0A2P6VK51_9CHLO|nr:N-acetyl-gamma-glutamyl-phosphate reductase [Micractinium conductrix]|eukprot:PSC74481.1 N-acetyl-gamma-glutamyl-phosphate reductase [Micractinium conductrix]